MIGCQMKSYAKSKLVTKYGLGLPVVSTCIINIKVFSVDTFNARQTMSVKAPQIH